MEEYTLKELIVNVYKFFWRYLYLYVIFVLIGGIYGYVKIKQQKPYYQAYIYVGTGLLANPRNFEYNINALNSDLNVVSTHISNKKWVKENMGLDTASFKSLKVEIEKSNYTRIYNPIKLRLSAYSKKDFERFKQGLKYYYTYRSPLIELYNKQLEVKDSLFKLQPVENFKKVIERQNLGSVVLSFSNVYDYESIKLAYQVPLIYFTSDFSSIRYVKKQLEGIVAYIVLGIIFAFILSLGIEIVRFSNNELSKEKK